MMRQKWDGPFLHAAGEFILDPRSQVAGNVGKWNGEGLSSDPLQAGYVNPGCYSVLCQ